jgi:RNA polymerase sigma-70 factor, ECF subfamily
MDGHRQDQTEQFVGLFAQNQYEIHSYVLTLVHNWADADDVMQATSIVLWRKFDQFQPGTNFVAWACQIARLEVNNFRRVRGRDRLMFDDTLLQSLATMRLSMGEQLQAEREMIDTCMANLRPDDRDLIHRCYGQKAVTAKEVAAELGRPTNTVYKALIRIRRALYECVQRTIKIRERQ